MQAGIGLDELLTYVERAIRGDRRLLVQLFRQMQLLAHHPTAPEEEKRLGEVVSRLLMGDRRPDLTCLPASMAAEIQCWLDRLKKPGAGSPGGPADESGLR